MPTLELPAQPQSVPAYVAQPAGTPRGGVIVIQEIFGVNDKMRGVADLCASAGYAAVVPAIFHRTDRNFEAPYDQDGVVKGRAAGAETTIDSLLSDLGAAVAYLHATSPGIKVATWGFCFGGSVAYLSATMPTIDAAISFYGGQIARAPIPGRPPMITLTDRVRVPLLLEFGADDAAIPAEDIDAIRTALTQAQKPFELVVEPNAGHGFFREGPQSSAASRDAWERVQRFLATHLG